MDNPLPSSERILCLLVMIFAFSFSPQSVSNAQGVMAVMAPMPTSSVIDVQHVSIFNNKQLLEDEEYFNDVINKLEKEFRQGTADAEMTLKRINDSMREYK